jgi:predicted dehydrogenase
MTGSGVPAVLLVGTSGYGSHHLRELLTWHRRGLIRLVALTDVRFTAETRRQVVSAGVDPIWAPSTLDALGRCPVDVAVVATPPHTHFEIAETVLGHRVGLYLEKPPVPLLAQLDALVSIPRTRRAQVGFQQTRAAIEAVESVLAGGSIGEVSRITAAGCLARPDAYYTRNSWAGSWFVEGQAVLDGPLFNPLAHVAHSALTLAGRIDPQWAPAHLEAEHYAVRDIAGDDTAVWRIRSRRGPEVVAVGTTAADTVREPSITAHGAHGSVTVRHRDAAGAVRVGGSRYRVPARSGRDRAVLDTVTDPGGAPDDLLDLGAVRPFVTITNAAVEAAGEPVRITAYQRRMSRGGDVMRTLPGISALVDDVVATGALFAELGAPWAHPARAIDLTAYGGLSHPELAAPRPPARSPSAAGSEAR